MNSRISFDRVGWLNTIFLFFISAMAVIGAPIYLWNFGLSWLMGSLFVFYILATGLSITLGYHRLFSHLSFKAKWPVRLATLVFGACAFENSALSWVSDHRRHHKHTDHDDDPYDISKGFLWAHIGWILFKRTPHPPLDNVADLRKDKLVMWQHRWDKFLAVGVGLILPSVIGYFSGGWVGALGGFLVVGALRVFLVQQCTFFINSLCHTVGSQPYSSKCSARDSTVMAFFTFGEGYHNFHHEFQHDYRNGVKGWCFDPTKWSIWLLQKVGLVSSLRRVPASQILLAEMAEARRKADQHLARLESGEMVCEQARESINEILKQLSSNYHEFERSMSERVEVSRKVISQWRRETRELVVRLALVRPEAA